MLMVIFLLHLHFIAITFPFPLKKKKTKLGLHHTNRVILQVRSRVSANVDMRVSINKMYCKLLDAANFAY